MNNKLKHTLPETKSQINNLHFWKQNVLFSMFFMLKVENESLLNKIIDVYPVNNILNSAFLESSVN